MYLAEFFPENPSGYYAYPVDPEAAMCLEVFAGMDIGREMVTATTDCQPHPSPAGQATPIRRYSTPGSSPSYEACLSRSPNALSDSAKNVKPQYTAELDVLCRICGDRASGFHYGVHSCEGCKGFFRRTLKKQLVYKPCQMGSQCKIDAGTRNKCQYCRYQRCLNAGMSQDAVRFGRMPKTEREKLMADKEELSSTNSKRIVELRSLADLIKAAFRDVFQKTIFFTSPDSLQSAACGSSSVAAAAAASTSTSTNIAAAHMPAVSSSSSSSSSCVSPFHPHMMEGPEILHTVSPEDFYERDLFWRFQEVILPVMEASVKFAKRLPGFTSLPMPDQIELMKQNGFMVVHLALHSIVENDMIRLDTETSFLRIYRHSPRLCEQLQKLLQRPLAVGDRLRSMRLTFGEMALFAAVLLTSERPGLASPKPVEDLQADLIEALRLDLKHNHPKDRLLLAKLLMLIPDLVQIVEEFCENLKETTKRFRNRILAQGCGIKPQRTTDKTLGEFNTEHEEEDGLQESDATQNRTFTFQDYLSVLSAWKLLEPDSLEVHKELTFRMYLSVLSTLHIAQVDEVFIHSDNYLRGYYWRKVSSNPKVTVVYREGPRQIFGHRILYTQHRSDIVRADVLDKYGGVYMDWDVLWLRSPSDLLASGHDAIVNFDHMPRPPYPDTINLGVLMAKPRSAFVRLWRQELRHYRSKDFFHNALEMPYKVYERHPDSVHIDRRLQVMCFWLKCHPTFHPDFKNWQQDQAFDWRTDVYSIHFTHPDPKEFDSVVDLLNGNGTFADIGKFILRRAGELD
nr:hypothetical protein BaRGS_001084 [Batillaria attramentaria]